MLRFNKVKAGDDIAIPADFFNALVDLLAAYETRFGDLSLGSNATSSIAFPDRATIQVNTAVTGGGFYRGRFYGPSNRITDTRTTLSSALDFSKAGDCYIANGDEYGQTTHRLTYSTTALTPTPILQGWFMDYGTDGTDILPLYRVNHTRRRVC